MILDLEGMPKDPIERIVWLSGVQDAVDQVLNPIYQKAYYEARLTGRLKQALDLHEHPKKVVMAFTRHENEANGRSVRWGDGER